MFISPEAAEEAFYSAFESKDLDMMRRIWSSDDSAVCIHPMGPRVNGAADIMQSWQAIFASEAELRFTTSHVVTFRDERVSVHCVHENIHHGVQFRQTGLVLATNAYRRESNGWRMMLHHGSPGGATAFSEAASDRSMH